MAPELKRRARAALGPVLAASVIGYFAWHAVQGERGLLAWQVNREKLAVREKTLAELQAQRDRLETKVNALRAPTLDRDVLDERARVMLNLTRPNEIVIKHGP